MLSHSLTLLLLLLSLSSFSTIAAAEGKSVVNISPQASFNLLIANADISEHLTPNPALKDATPAQEHPLANEVYNFKIFNEHRRFVSSDNRAGVGAKPNYFLQIAFFEPAIFNRFIPPVEKPKFASHWTSQLSSTVSRLSGWKDGNSLYTHNHIRFS